MFSSKIKTRYRFLRKSRICQGDIFRDLKILLDVKFDLQKNPPKIKTSTIILPYAIVMTQDCDLESDLRNRNEKPQKNQDKYLQTILICPAYQEDQFAEGKHISNMLMRSFNGSEKDKIKRNDEFKRYHFLQKEEHLSIPGLVIDFKNFYTLPRENLYKQKKTYVGTLSELFREELSQRFAYFLSRIGLPVLK